MSDATYRFGCVTPLQIGNIISQLGGLDGLDLNEDLDGVLDGYEELPEWAQDKIKYALEHGHVHDEEWRGVPEKNRAGEKGINKRTPKKKATDEEATGDSATEVSPAKPKKAVKKKASKKDDDENPDPRKKAASRKRKAADSEDDAEEVVPPPKKRGGRGKKAVVKDEAVNVDEPTTPPTKKARGKKVKPESADDGEARSGLADMQNDGAADVKDEEQPKPAAKKRGKKAAATKTEEDVDEPEPVPKPAKKGRGKKAAAPKAEPGDEETENVQPEADTGALEEAKDDEVTAPAKKGRTRTRQNRGSRASDAKA